MADAREKLQAAIAAKQGAPRAPSPPKAPKKKAPPPKPEPPPLRKPKEEPEKPAAKKASFFKKSKKKKKPKASEKQKKAPKAEKKQKKEKKKGSGFFQKFVSDLKEAAEDIKPKALVSSASEGLGSLKSMVASGNEEDADREPKSKPAKKAAASAERDESTTAAQAEVESGSTAAAASTSPSSGPPPAQDEAAPAPASGAPSAAPSASEGDAPPSFSTVKVQKATPKKKRTPKPPKPKKDLTEELEEAVAAAPEDEPVSATPEIGEEETQDSIQPEPEEIQADREEVEAPTETEELEPLEADEPEVVSASAEEAEAVGVADEPKQEPASSQKSEEASGGKKKAKKLPQKQVQQVSKSEQLMRSFQALQILLNDETWSPVVTDPESRPSTLGSEIPIFEIQLSFDDGRVLPVDTDLCPVDIEGQRRRLLHLRDIRRRKAAETRSSMIFEYIGDGILITDQAGVVLLGSRSAAELTGYSRDEIVGLDIAQFHSEEGAARWQDLVRRQESEPGIYEDRLKRKDGREIPVEWTMAAFSVGSEAYFIGVARNLTDRKSADEKRMEAERLNTLLEIAGGAAHEINQPLTAILGYAEMALDSLGKDDATYSYQQQIVEAALRINDILKRMQAVREYRTRPYADGHQIVDFEQSSSEEQ